MKLLAAILLAAAPALAGSVSDEVVVNKTDASAVSPRSGSVGNSLNARFDASDTVRILGGLDLTLESATPAAQRGQFGTSGSVVSLLTGGVEVDVTESWTLGLSGEFAPDSTQYAGTELNISSNKGTGTYNALLKAVSSQEGLVADVSWDSNGESDLEWAFDGSAGYTHLSSTQNVDRVKLPSGVPVDKTQIEAACKGSPSSCNRALLKALAQTPATVDQGHFQAGVTATLWRDTDVGLSGDVYAYGSDPTQVGYFSLAAAGKQAVRGGNGVPIAPLRDSLRPELTHRFGDFSVRLYAEAGDYVQPPAGSGNNQYAVNTRSAGVKLQYKFTKAFKLWVTASGQTDNNADGSNQQSGSFAMGAQLKF